MKLLFVALLCVSAPLSAQDNSPVVAQHTSPIPEARFELVQSPLSRDFTFRLDRNTGRIWLLVNLGADIWLWEETPVPDLVPVATPTHARFQLHISGVGGSNIILIDTETSITWQYKKNKANSRNGFGWEVLSER